LWLTAVPTDYRSPRVSPLSLHDALPISKLRGRRVLVVDSQDEVRSSAHSLLEPYGCVVETAQKGSEAELLYQLSMNNDKYDVVVDRKSTRLNSSHLGISYAVFCLKKKVA